MKQGIIATLVVIAIITGAVMLGGKNTVTAEPTNHFRGQEDGIITLTEFADFECPACGSYFPIVEAVKEEFQDKVRFEFVHFPLVQIHQNAVAAHRAAEAASNQGKFWEMHDLLFANQAQWKGSASTNPSAIFETFANQLELNMDQYLADVAKSETLAVINADVAKGKEAGVTGTPTFFIDGVQIEDQTKLSTIEGFKEVVQSAIDAKKGGDNTKSE